MRNTKLTSSNFFGLYHTKESILQIGDVQSMQFSSIYVGPCYFTSVEREEIFFDRTTGRVMMRDLIREELIISLKDFGVKEPKGSKKRFKN